MGVETYVVKPHDLDEVNWLLLWFTWGHEPSLVELYGVVVCTLSMGFVYFLFFVNCVIRK